MNSLIIGTAGFIGSNLALRLLKNGNTVIGIDNFSRGSEKNIEQLIKFEQFQFYQIDASDLNELSSFFSNLKIQVDEVWHFAANSDIPTGIENPTIDLQNTFLTTFHILRNMKIHSIKTIHFASSSAIYGDFNDELIHENIGPLLPISNYGAMKLASEAQISAASEDFLSCANIYRFPNVVGTPATHGVIFDFINKLILTPDNLVVLGNGLQQKSYLHVSDLIDAMFTINKVNNIQKCKSSAKSGPIESIS